MVNGAEFNDADRFSHDVQTAFFDGNSPAGLEAAKELGKIAHDCYEGGFNRDPSSGVLGAYNHDSAARHLPKVTVDGSGIMTIMGDHDIQRYYKDGSVAVSSKDSLAQAVHDRKIQGCVYDSPAEMPKFQ